MGSDPHAITSERELDALYGEAVPIARLKELDHVSVHYRAFIEASPFMILATVGPEGLDCSPRGDPKGFVRVADEKTLLIPDRRGNNRIDSLRNIVRDPRVALLFLVPGVGETMRVNGLARLTKDPSLCESFAMEGKLPGSVIVVTAQSVYPQCQKALARSRLWDPAIRIARSALPSIGEMMETITCGTFDGKAYDAAYPQRMKETIY
jgi:hypothetical protein